MRPLWLLLLLSILWTAIGLVSPVDAGQNTLTWTDNSSGDGQESVFEIERKAQVLTPPPSTPPATVDCLVVPGAYSPLATAPQDATTYVDTAAPAGSIYCYRVRARGASGLVSPYSNEAGRYVPLVTGAAPSGLSVGP